jgi:hypothetical protein
MSEEPRIITREKKMVEAMVKIYCENHHNTKNSLCSKCIDIKEYAINRLEKSSSGKETCLWKIWTKMLQQQIPRQHRKSIHVFWTKNVLPTPNPWITTHLRFLQKQLPTKKRLKSKIIGEIAGICSQTSEMPTRLLAKFPFFACSKSTVHL